MLMQFTIQKQKGFTHGMTFHTEFHRPLPKTKGGVAITYTGFCILMQCSIQKQKGSTYGMTCHTEFHRPRTKTKGSPKRGRVGRMPPPPRHAPFHFW